MDLKTNSYIFIISIFFIFYIIPLLYKLVFKQKQVKKNLFYYIIYVGILLLANIIATNIYKEFYDLNTHEQFLISPILDNHSLIDGDYIDQGEIKVSKDKLSTSHLGTCSALVFTHNNKNFLGHIDAQSNTAEDIIQKIKTNFNVEELKKKKDIYIIPGSWCNENKCDTFNTIKKSLKILGLEYKLYSKKINWENNNSIYIDKNGVSIM